MSDPGQNPYVSTPNSVGSVTSPLGGATTLSAAAVTGMVITFALISGIGTITAVMLFLSLPGGDAEQSLLRFGGEDILFLGAGALLCFGGVTMGLVIHRVMLHRAQSQLNASAESLPQPLRDDSELPANAQSFVGSITMATLVSQALMEGPAIVNAILMMLSGNLAHLILIALSIIGILWLTPTPGRLRAQMEQSR